MRVTSEQVDDVLSNDLIYSPTVYDICRDWLDMQAVIAAAREYHDLCEMWDAAMDARDPGTLDLLDEEIPAVRQRLWDAVASLSPARDETAVG